MYYFCMFEGFFAVYEKYREDPETAYQGCSMGIIYRDPEDSYYDEAEFAIVKGNTIFGNLMDDVRFYVTNETTYDDISCL